VASISKQPNGRRTIQVMVSHGGRKVRPSIRLGKVSQRLAESVKVRIEHLAAAKASGQPIDGDTAEWLAGIGDTLHGRLAAVGLVQPRETQAPATLGPFLTDYLERRQDVEPATRTVWRHTVRNLRDCFGDGRDLASITPGDGEDFKLYLVAEKLASTTIAKRLQFARQFFEMARKRRLIDSNPFSDVKAKAISTADRQRFITREVTERFLAVCNPTWRLILCLGRYGGLRCPSEVLSLKWQGVDWEAGRITVESPKTKRHGKGTRLIPMFPELRPVLEEAFDAAPEGAVHVVDADNYRRAAQGPNGWQNANLRTQFERLLKRAGVEPWPRLFHNLRASRETELAADFPVHVVTAWLGNTPRVAMKHYLQVTDSDFERASKGGAKSGAEAVQNQVQSMQATIGYNAQETTQAPVNQGLGPIVADWDLKGLTPKMEMIGLEPTTPALQKRCSPN